MIDAASRGGVLCGLSMLLATGLAIAGGGDPCEGVDCSGHGECKVMAEHHEDGTHDLVPFCQCDEGFIRDDMARDCLPDLDVTLGFCKDESYCPKGHICYEGRCAPAAELGKPGTAWCYDA